MNKTSSTTKKKLPSKPPKNPNKEKYKIKLKNSIEFQK